METNIWKGYSTEQRIQYAQDTLKEIAEAAKSTAEQIKPDSLANHAENISDEVSEQFCFYLEVAVTLIKQVDCLTEKSLRIYTSGQKEDEY